MYTLSVAIKPDDKPAGFATIQITPEQLELEPAEVASRFLASLFALARQELADRQRAGERLWTSF